MGVIAISACLMGIQCRYNGTSADNDELCQLFLNRNIELFCPEVSGNLPIPRKPAEIVNGDGKDVIQGNAFVINIDGLDVTQAFIKGAVQTIDILTKKKVSAVVLKDRSPSCGVDEIYDGNFSGRLIEGCGVFTALLQNQGIGIFSDKKIESLKQWLEQEGEKE